MKLITVAGALALAFLSSAAQAEPASPDIGLFAQDAGTSNAFEIEESKIVLQDSTDPKLRAFAKEMIHDHETAQTELDRAARPSGVETHYIFTGVEKQKVDDLGLMDSPKLDQTYLADQVEAHAQTAATLGDYAINGEDPALRAYARMTLPVVLRHQRMLEQMTGQPASF